LPHRVISRLPYSESLYEPCLHFGLGGVTDIFWGQNHKILLKNAKKMYNNFIFTSILNPSESSYDKCHRLSFLMSETQFLCYIGHIGTKTHRYLTKICETITSK
jgi:hypothetical protein